MENYKYQCCGLLLTSWSQSIGCPRTPQHPVDGLGIPRYKVQSGCPAASVADPVGSEPFLVCSVSGSDHKVIKQEINLAR